MFFFVLFFLLEQKSYTEDISPWSAVNAPLKGKPINMRNV